MESRKKGQTVHDINETRNIVARIIKKCDKEARQGHLIYLLNQSTKRAVDYTGISERTINRIRKESSVSGEQKLSSPGKKRPRCMEKKLHFSEEYKTVIRDTINEFYLEKKIVPTAAKILHTIKEKIQFPWTKHTLYRLLNNMGFKYKKSNSNRKLIIERPNIVTWRTKYLRAVQHYRTQNRNIIYIDETWVDNSMCFSKCWQSEDTLGVLENNSSSCHLIIVHAGGKNGFVNGAELIFKAKTKTGDYHGQMNAVNFEKWVTEKLLPNIPEKSVIVMDNAPYHSVQLNKPAAKSEKKQVLLKWLNDNKIPCTNQMKKCELIELVQQNKKLDKTYKIDESIKEQGHNVLKITTLYVRFKYH